MVQVGGNKMKKLSGTLLMVAIGTFILALSVEWFILPFNILSGGVAGIAVSLEPLLGIDANITINVLIVSLFLLGTAFLGKDFAVKTFLSTLFYPLFLYLLQKLELPALAIDPLLASLYGGIVAGLGIGLVFRVDASTGGMDIPPMIIHKYTGIPLSKLVFIVDAITVILGAFAYGIEAVLIGFIAVWTCSFMINKVLVYGGESAKSVYVISEKRKEISDYIHHHMERGSTILEAKGGFTGDKREMLLVVVTQKQYPEFVKVVKNLDEKAFLIVQDATEVHGEGFSFEYKV